MDIVVHRPPRRTPGQQSFREYVLATPPLKAATGPGALLPAVLPALAGMGMLLFMVAGRRPLFIVAGLVMVLVTVGGALALAISSRSGVRKESREARMRYLQYLETVREELRAAASTHRQHASVIHPAPCDLTTFVCSPRLYERRRGDADAGLVRIGVGALPHPVTLRWPQPPNPLTPLDPMCHRAAVGVAHDHRLIADQPIALPCTDARSILVVSRSREDVLAVARCLLMGLSALHSPDDLALAVHSPTTDLNFVHWMPHARVDGHPLVATCDPELADALASATDIAQKRWLVVIADEWGTGGQGDVVNATVVRLLHPNDREPEEVDMRVDIEHGTATMSAGADRCEVTLDRPSAQEATALARGLAGRGRTREVPRRGAVSNSHDVRDLLSWAPGTHWRYRDTPAAEGSLLTATVGVADDGSSVVLDLKDSARGGMGPHGLIIGATGSGKSELLRTLVLSLACQHSPQELSFVLVDYKGGATFAGLEDLPHTAGSITNLALDGDLVGRMRDSLTGEVRRRQHVLAENGHHPDLFAYRTARREDPSLPPLPHQVVIIDEFAELLGAEPSFLDTLHTIGRIGRSLGIHLVLASQRLDDGRLRGLESHLSFRVALRTFTADESRAVLGGPQAAELPSRPGLGYVRVATGAPLRFFSDYVSGPARQGLGYRPSRSLHVLTPGHRSKQPRPEPAPSQATQRETAASLLEVLVARMAEASEPVHRIWLPPLPARLTLADLDTFADEVRPLHVRVGLVDLPGQQRQEPFDLDIGRAQTALLGGPRSGRSSALRTIAMDLARRYAPEHVIIHALDLDGEGLAQLTRLPHVGTVAPRHNVALVERVLRELTEELRHREAQGVPSAAPGDGAVRVQDAPHIVVLLDGYAILRGDYEDEHDRLVELVMRGIPYGIHVVLTAARWHDLRPGLQVSVAARIELPLVDPLDSTLDRSLSTRLRPERHPGRAVTGAGCLTQLALPSVLPVSHSTSPQADEAESISALAGQLARAAAPIRLLPPVVLLDDLRSVAPLTPGRIAVGLAEDTSTPVELNFLGRDPHLLIVGDDGSGRTTFLRHLGARLVAERPLGEVIFALIDPLGSLRDALPPEAVTICATDTDTTYTLAASLAQELSRRRTEAGFYPALICLADDVELVVTPGASPLQPLLPHLPRARELSFHLILARHGGGASRALFDPVLGRIKELGCPGILLAGDAEEGPLWPRAHLAPRPPGRGLLVRRGASPRVIQMAL